MLRMTEGVRGSELIKAVFFEELFFYIRSLIPRQADGECAHYPFQENNEMSCSEFIPKNSSIPIPPPPTSNSFFAR